jgi:hypothetical protein
LQIVIAVVVTVVVVAIVIVVLGLTRRLRRRHDRLSESDDTPPKTIDFCSDDGLTINTTLTATLTSPDPIWSAPAGAFDGAGFGLQL